jgi:integrase
LRDALDLAYLTGQRPADVLKLSRADIKDGALHIQQAKTKKRLRIQIEGQFAALLQRLSSKKVTSLILINNKAGYPLSKAMLSGAFDQGQVEGIESETRPLRTRSKRSNSGICGPRPGRTRRKPAA